MAALDDLLVLVEPQQLAGGQLAGDVGRQRVDPVGARGLLDRLVVALVGERRLALGGADADGDQPLDVLADDLPDAALDLGLGLLVAPAEPALDALELLLGLGQRPLSGGGDLRVLLAGVDVGDAEAPVLAGLGILEFPA